MLSWQFSSLVQDPKTLSVITNARSQSGVHVYFESPHTQSSKSYITPLTGLDSTKSNELIWTSLLHCTGPNFAFAMTLPNQSGTDAIEYGYKNKAFYGSVMEGQSWHEATLLPRTVSVGDFIALTARLKYSPGTSVEPIEYEINGEKQTKTSSFSAKKRFPSLGSKISQHDSLFQHTELLETHFLCIGITDALPARHAKSDYISLKEASLCFLSTWSRAVIIGKRIKANKKYEGVVLGVATDKSAVFHNFESSKNNTGNLTFLVTIGIHDVSIASEKETKVWDFNLKPAEHVWLLVDNINILNLQIFTTAIE